MTPLNTHGSNIKCHEENFISRFLELNYCSPRADRKIPGVRKIKPQADIRCDFTLQLGLLRFEFISEIFVSIYAFWDFYKDFQIKKICGLIRLEKIIHQLSTTVSRVYQMFGGYSYATCRREIMLKLTFYLWNIALNLLDLKLHKLMASKV